MSKGQRKYQLHNGRSGAAITVRVTPRASRNEIHEITNDGTLKVRLTSPNEEEMINQALIQFLGEVLGVPISKIEIVAGKLGKDKLVTILDIDSNLVQERVIRHLS